MIGLLAHLLKFTKFVIYIYSLKIIGLNYHQLTTMNYTKKLLTIISSILFLSGTFFPLSLVQASSTKPPTTQTSISVCSSATITEKEHHGQAIITAKSQDTTIPIWLVIPFILLLLMIATGPLLYAHFWHRHYPKVAVGLAVGVIAYYILVLHNVHKPVEALVDYISFIALIASLFMASSGILIKVNRAGTPLVNIVLLLFGALISNLIGTTGASMLLIRPFIRLNKKRIKVYHIIFFIFMVSNVGGALTPIGDPPLFLGFLKGVPFLWTVQHNFLAWGMVLTILSILFYLFDSRNKTGNDLITEENEKGPLISIQGKNNFFWLSIIILSVFIDPKIFSWVPSIHNHSFVRELIMFSVVVISYRTADPKVLKENEFNFEPLKEVAFIFIGIFGTMIPALELISNFAQSDVGKTLITHNTLYWGAGVLSSMLDNAPTYLNFLTASMASQGADVNQVADVQAYAMNSFSNSALNLSAISIASVFFGAMTYIGNGPNFMVRSIAEQQGIRMPSFFGYVFKYSITCLLPALILVWLVFFAFAG